MDCAKTTTSFESCAALVSERSLALIVLLATAIAFLPVGSWVVQRTFDGSDEPWGLVALVTLMFYGWSRRDKLPGWTCALLSNSLMPSVLMLAYAVSQWFCPMLVRALLSVSIIACFIAAAAGDRSRLRVSHWALLVMSLPLLPSLHFFLGYPLRVAVAHTVASLVGVSGVTVDGTGLLYQGHLVAIDSPCSGVRMLWSSVYLALALSCFYRHSNKQTLLIGALAVAAAFTGNVMRAGSLLYGYHLASIAPREYVVQHGGYSEFPYFHDVIGASSFLLVVAALLAAVHFLKAPVLSAQSAAVKPQMVRMPTLGSRQVVLYLLAVCLAVVVSCMNMFQHELSAQSDDFNGWPKSFEGQSLYPLSMSDWELNFASHFPGRIAKFSDGRRQVIMRWIRRETRQLHSLQDCLKGSGYAISRQSISIQEGGQRWVNFTAEKPGSCLSVKERITDDAGGAWTDVSQWYWSALTGKTRGPWLAVSVIEEELFKSAP
jgi:exosortase/archaeosortase family protein